MLRSLLGKILSVASAPRKRRAPHAGTRSFEYLESRMMLSNNTVLIDFESEPPPTFVADHYASVGLRVTGVGAFSGLVYEEGNFGVKNFGNSPTHIMDIGEREEPTTLHFVSPSNPANVLGAESVAFRMGDGDPDAETFRVTIRDVDGDVLDVRTITTGANGITIAASSADLGRAIGTVELFLLKESQSGVVLDDIQFESSLEVPTQPLKIASAQLYDIDSVQVGPNLPLEFLSISSENPYFGGNTRINGVIRIEGDPQDALDSLELQVFQGGQLRATAHLSSAAQGLLHQFGPLGVIEVTASQLLFELPNVEAAGINLSQNGTLDLRIVATSALGGAVSFSAGDVQILTLYTGDNRYGVRDQLQGGDDWVLPSVKSLLSTFTGVLWNDVSNMNGGNFPPHAGHRRGFDVDFKFTGYQPGQTMVDNKGAKLLADIINALPLNTLSRITTMFASVDDKFIKRLEKELADDRKDFVLKINKEPAHVDHFHIVFTP